MHIESHAILISKKCSHRMPPEASLARHTQSYPTTDIVDILFQNERKELLDD